MWLYHTDTGTALHVLLDVTLLDTYLASHCFLNTSNGNFSLVTVVRVTVEIAKFLQAFPPIVLQRCKTNPWNSKPGFEV